MPLSNCQNAMKGTKAEIQNPKEKSELIIIIIKGIRTRSNFPLQQIVLYKVLCRVTQEQMIHRERKNLTMFQQLTNISGERRKTDFALRR